MISYAQNFEDVLLARVFKGRNDGFYVDVGAADPVNLSVTKWFYDLGWRGINIEPNRQLFERLAHDRPRDLNIECGVGALAGEAEFFEFEVGELSTFDRGALDRLPSATPRRRTVPIVPLTELLDKHHKDQPISFLKIDVEGWEKEVLKGLDLTRYRPVVMIIEATVPQDTTSSHEDWESIVTAAGFTFVYFDGLNRFYLANECIDLRKHFLTPPNVFDDFEQFPLVRARTDAEERLKSIQTLEAVLAESEADRSARLVVIEELSKRLIEIDATVARSQTDRAAQSRAIDELSKQLEDARSPFSKRRKDRT